MESGSKQYHKLPLKPHNTMKKECKDNRENDVWKENYITISQEPRLENSQGRNCKKNKKKKKTTAINTYLSEQYHRSERTNLCRSEISLY